MVPTVKLNGPDSGQTYTSGSKVHLYAQADDLDGSLDWVRFYVNGDPYGEPISAYLGKSSANYPYGTNGKFQPQVFIRSMQWLWTTVATESCLEFPPLQLPPVKDLYRLLNLFPRLKLPPHLPLFQQMETLLPSM